MGSFPDDRGAAILCADMDAFFASVEQKANPRLRGRPVAVIGSGGRTVVVTRSYEARAYGVKTGMTVYEAERLCPDIVFVVGDNEKYAYTCAELSRIYARFTPDVEVYSIDEAFLDITRSHHLFGGAEEVGKSIKKAVYDRFGINCTIGIAPNVLMAKLASDISKPDGLRWIRKEEVEAVLRGLPVKELWGIGDKLSARLGALGIRTCDQLGSAPASLLRSKFGIIGETLKLMGLGVWERPVMTKEAAPKSIGHSMTLPEDIFDINEIKMNILKLSEMVGRRARRHGFTGRKVSLTIRYPDFETFTRQATLGERINGTRAIYECALSILASVRLGDGVRLIGVCLSDLAAEGGQISLFGGRERGLLSAVDSVNDRFGDFTLTWAAYVRIAGGARVISPAWRPSGVRNIKVR